MFQPRSAAFEKRWRRCLRALRVECPTLLPVRVVRFREPGPVRMCAWAAVVEGGAGFRVVIRELVYERGASRSRRMNDSEMIEVLMHEWAHCMAWHGGHSDLQDHSPAWGVAYSECYRAVIED